MSSELAIDEASAPKKRRIQDVLSDGDAISLPAESPAPQRGAVWFEDGSVILQAETTQFRVHKSVLSEHSPVLKAMLLSPEKYDQVTVGSCPVLKLDDEEDELEDMLQTIYRPSYSEMVRDTSDFPMIRSWLLLGRKYEIPHLTLLAHRRISAKFPLVLAEYEKHEGDTVFTESEDDHTVDSLLVAYLALSFRIPLIPEFAYYDCICNSWSPQFFFDSFETAKQIAGDDFAEHAETIRQAIYAGHPRILAGRHKLMLDLLCSTPCTACRRKPQCSEGMRALLVQAHKSDVFDSVAKIPTPLWLLSIGMNDRLCRRCCETLQAELDEKRMSLWKEIPKMFSLDEYPPEGA